MARQRSDEKRKAILEAATRIIAVQGLGAPTALIAKEAGISNGALFTYFETKTELLNQVYVGLKTEMGRASLEGLSVDADVRRQLEHMWSGWLRWTTADPCKHRALAQLSASEAITEQSREIGHQALHEIAGLLERARNDGAMRAAPLRLVVSLLNAVANTTVDFMISDPVNADAHRKTGFDAMWRMIA